MDNIITENKAEAERLIVKLEEDVNNRRTDAIEVIDGMIEEVNNELLARQTQLTTKISAFNSDMKKELLKTKVERLINRKIITDVNAACRAFLNEELREVELA
jgi:hypothetical protein